MSLPPHPQLALIFLINLLMLCCYVVMSATYYNINFNVGQVLSVPASTPFIVCKRLSVRQCRQPVRHRSPHGAR